MATDAVRGSSAGHRLISVVGVVLAAVLGLTACGQQAPTSVAADIGGSRPRETGAGEAQVVRLAPGDDTPRLTCPTGERSLMIADFAFGARGAPTPEDAVGPTSLGAGEQLVVSSSGSRVWILRPDGTAREAIHLTHRRGWILHMRESCA
jgi:hypothetical protein